MILCTKFQFSTLSFKVQRTLMSLLSRLGLWRTLEVPYRSLDSSSRYKYVQLPNKNIYTNLSFLHGVLRCKELSCHYCQDSCCGGCWIFLIEVWNLYQLMNRFSYPRRIPVLNFSFLYWFLRCKELSCPYCLDWSCGGCWRFLIGDWSLH